MTWQTLSKALLRPGQIGRLLIVDSRQRITDRLEFTLLFYQTYFTVALNNLLLYWVFKHIDILNIFEMYLNVKNACTEVRKEHTIRVRCQNFTETVNQYQVNLQSNLSDLALNVSLRPLNFLLHLDPGDFSHFVYWTLFWDH